MSEPEDPRISLFAEKIAQDCRDLATVLLTKNGTELVDSVAETVAAMSQLARNAIGGDFDSFSGTPENPPRASRDGQIRVNSSPVRSHRNVLAPPARLSRTETGSEFAVRLPIQYQGPPGTLQGGFCSVFLDDAMWDAVHVVRPGISFTRTLSVEYLKPVPLGEIITITGRVVGSDGRKTFAEGAIVDARGQICTTAQGLWVAPRAE